MTMHEPEELYLLRQELVKQQAEIERLHALIDNCVEGIREILKEYSDGD